MAAKALVKCYKKVSLCFFIIGPRTLIRIASYEDPLKIDLTSESVSANPLGDERTEGPGLESVTNLISVDSLLGGISENFSNIGDRFGSLFRRTSIPAAVDEGSNRSASPAEEAISGNLQS